MCYVDIDTKPSPHTIKKNMYFKMKYVRYNHILNQQCHGIRSNFNVLFVKNKMLLIYQCKRNYSMYKYHT